MFYDANNEYFIPVKQWKPVQTHSLSQNCMGAIIRFFLYFCSTPRAYSRDPLKWPGPLKWVACKIPVSGPLKWVGHLSGKKLSFQNPQNQ